MSVLAPHQVHVWHLDLNVSETALADFMTMLSAAEREQASRYHHRQDAQRFIARRGLSRATLSRYLGHSPEMLEFVVGPQGKPYLVQAEHTDALHFNYSHSENRLLIAVSSRYELGIDVECRKWSEDFRDIARLYFSAKEQHLLANTQYPQELFFKCWTAKEAIVKALGQGLSRPLHDFTVFTAQGTLREWLPVGEAPRVPIRLHALPVQTGAHATLAIIGAADLQEVEVIHC